MTSITKEAVSKLVDSLAGETSQSPMNKIDIFNGQYTLYEDGRVYSNKRKRFIKPYPQYRGYLLMGLSQSGKYCVFTQHRLVATYFLPNPEKYTEINHKDGVKTNNHVSNLEWCTHDQNMKHAVENALMANGSKHHSSKLTENSVREIRRLYAQGGLTHKSLGQKYGVHPSCITEIINLKSWSHVR